MRNVLHYKLTKNIVIIVRGVLIIKTLVFPYSIFLDLFLNYLQNAPDLNIHAIIIIIIIDVDIIIMVHTYIYFF